MNIDIFSFLMFLFLKILYNKILYINCVLKLYILSIVVIHSNRSELTQRGVQSTVWKGRDLFSEDDPKND